LEQNSGFVDLELSSRPNIGDYTLKSPKGECCIVRPTYLRVL